jgi:hypothetical protein
MRKKITVFGRIIILLAFMLPGCGQAEPAHISTPTPTTTSVPASLTITSEPQSKKIFLSELTPSIKHYVYGEPEVGTLGGMPLQAHGNIYANGIVAHAPATLSYELKGQYSQLVTDLVFSDATSINARCGDGAYFVIILDGEILYKSSIVNFDSEPIHVALGISGGNILRLDTYGSMDINAENECDWTFWGNPYLITNPSTYQQIPSATKPIADFSPPTGPSSDFYVSPDGDDNNPGTLDRPFASIQHAKDIVRLVNENIKSPINVYLRGGKYHLSETIVFSSQDSGRNGSNVIYLPYQNEIPIISGGVDVSGFQSVLGQPYWILMLPENIKLFRNLYINGNRAIRAHTENPIAGIGWTKGDYSDFDGIILDTKGPGWWVSNWVDWEISRMIMNPDDLPLFQRPQDLELHWILDWVDIRALVSEIVQLESNKIVIMMKQPFFNWARGINPGEEGKWTPRWDVPFYIENALELMDQPGEWYYNKDTHELYYYPQPGEKIQSVTATIPQLETLISLKGTGVGDEVHNIEFKGLTFSYNSWMRASIYGTASNQAQWLQDGIGGYNYSSFIAFTPAAIQLDHSRNILFNSNIVEHIGSVGMGLNNDVGDVQIVGNVFQDISDSSITLSNGFRHVYITEPSESAVRNILINNNLIYKTSIEYWGAPGITSYFADHIEISHNLVKEINYSGISVGWGHSAFPDSTSSHDNLILNNRIDRVSLSGINGNPEFSGDAGGIYTLGQQPGTRIMGNYIKDVLQNYACIYIDEGSAFLDIQNNVCENAPSLFNQNLTSQHDNTLMDNYSNVNTQIRGGEKIIIWNNRLIFDSQWPVEAQLIIENAGLESPYLYLLDYIGYK